MNVSGLLQPFTLIYKEFLVYSRRCMSILIWAIAMGLEPTTT